MAEQLTLHQHNDLSNDVVDVKRRLLNFGLVCERTDAADHLARPAAGFDDPLHRTTRRVQIRGSAVEPAETSFSVGYDTGERLIYFVGDRGCQFAQSRHAR